VNARIAVLPHGETPLHWAASSDDIEVLDTLLDVGADMEASGAVIAGGTPLDDAVAFGQWKAARRLVERGAAFTLWHTAALGLLDDMEAYFIVAPERQRNVLLRLILDVMCEKNKTHAPDLPYAIHCIGAVQMLNPRTSR